MKFYFTLFLSCFLFIQTQQAQTTLSAGDASLLWIDLTTPDDFGFVTFVDLDVGTRLYFNENGATNAGVFDTGEGVLEFEVTIMVPAGTIIQYNNIVYGNWNTIAGSFAFSSSGDQLFIFQDGDGVGGNLPQNNPVFIHAVNASSRDKGDNCDFTDSQQTDSPSALTPVTFGDGPGTFMALGTGTGCQDENDFLHFTGGSDFASIAAAKAAIQDPDNWLGGGSSNVSANSTYTTAVAALIADGDGITQTCTDAAPPTISCPATQNRNLDGNCNYQVEDFTGLATTADDCGPVTVTQSPAANQTFNGPGTTVITLTATDASGNTATCNMDLNLVDNTPPSISCPGTPSIAGLNVNCEKSLSDYTAFVDADDNCDMMLDLTQSPAAMTTITGEQDLTVTVTATDDAGLTASCTYVILFRDVTLPTISCPADITVDAPANQCFAAVTYANPTTSDNCTGETSSYDILSGSNFNIGTTTVTGTVTDAAGNSAQCTFDVTVNDVTNPSATCPNDVTVSAPQGQCGTTVTYAGPLVSDACGIAYVDGVVCAPASGSFFDVGSTPVTCTVMDMNGNSSTCSFNIIVNDNEAPVTNCPTVPAQANDPGVCGAVVNFSFFSPSDNCPGTSQSATHGPGYFPVGSTTVTVTATDASGNTSTCSFDVTVNDTEVPDMVCNNFDVTLTGPSVSITPAQVDGGSTDNCAITNLSLDNNTFACNTLGAQTVTLTGTDAAGNQSSCTGTVTVIDNNPPTALCKTNTTVNLTSDGTTTVAASFFDDGSSAVCGNVTLSASQTDFDCGDVGNTIAVTLTVTADNNQTATCTSMVTVTDDDSFCCAPANAVCNNTTVMLDALGMGSIMPSDVGGGSMAECGLMSESVTPMDFDCSDVGSPVSVTYTITDINGATSSCTATVTVEDNIAPVPTCVNTTVQLDGNGNGTLAPSAIHGGSMEACGFLPLSATPTSLTCDDIGTVTATLTVSDVNGNSATCTATVTVEDNIPPTPVCKTTTVELQPNGMYTLTESDVYDALASDDNCSIDNVSFTPATYDCDDENQTFNVPVTVTDAGGNMTDCNASITVAVGNALPNGWSANDVGNSGTLGNDFSFDPCANTNGEFEITGGGNNATSSTTDNVAFASQTLCGQSVSITAKIESVDPNGYGGLMIRETTAAGSKQVAIFSNLTNILRHEVRYTTNGPKQVSAFYKPFPIWLRVQRQGNWVFAYYSNNGVSFQYVHGVFVPMQNCVQVGLASFTYFPGQQTTTTFSNVTVSGGTIPTVEATEFPQEASTARLQQGISLFPNPTSNIVNLMFEDGLSKDATVILRNQLGQVVEQRELRAGDYQTEWNVSSLADGLYLFEIRQEGEAVKVLRLVKTN